MILMILLLLLLLIIIIIIIIIIKLVINLENRKINTSKRSSSGYFKS
ncbi:unnamed protein product [Schistosoma margrebowiei]|uniref:Uncharacterized protein n=1 Tax=Schistosoma margrebowiei TaxID=48269 RepID=A0A3P8ELT6_9TREM|nr:unnamed protein product [Schistosoma margrebowiei]